MVATPSSLAEPGGSVSFQVQATNTSANAATLTSLTDSLLGNLGGQGTCAVGGTIAPGADLHVRLHDLGDRRRRSRSRAGRSTAVLTDQVDATTASPSGSATVTITDIPSSITVTKTANPTSLPEPGGPVTFTVVVRNTSAVDSITIDYAR